MRGEILTYDTTTQTGFISGDDSLRYSFSVSEVQGGASLAVGARVDFIPVDDQATQIVVLAATTTPYGQAGHAPIPVEPAYDFKTAMLSFKGRLRRQHFWISWLILLGISVLFGWIPYLGYAVSLALLWPSFAIYVKRLHDMGKSGWLVLIPLIPSLIGTAFMVINIVGLAITHPEFFTDADALEYADPEQILALFAGIFVTSLFLFFLNLAFLLWIGLSQTQPGDNKYGPVPKTLS